MCVCVFEAPSTCAVPHLDLDLYLPTLCAYIDILYTLSKHFKIFHSHRINSFSFFRNIYSLCYCSNIFDSWAKFSKNDCLYYPVKSLKLKSISSKHLITFVCGVESVEFVEKQNCCNLDECLRKLIGKGYPFTKYTQKNTKFRRKKKRRKSYEQNMKIRLAYTCVYSDWVELMKLGNLYRKQKERLFRQLIKL